jgi:ubiquinone/menaquinone biosynthesis C-methylase UbiE
VKPEGGHKRHCVVHRVGTALCRGYGPLADGSVPVTVCDINQAMLDVGAERASKVLPRVWV